MGEGKQNTADETAGSRLAPYRNPCPGSKRR